MRAFLRLNIIMAAYNVPVSSTSQTSPPLKKGKIRIVCSVNVFWALGANPTANTKTCTALKANTPLVIVNPFPNNKIAFVTSNESGSVTVTEVLGGASSSCAQ